MLILKGLLVVSSCLFTRTLTEAVYVQSIPTFTLTLISSNSDSPPKQGYLQSLGEDVRSFLSSYLQKSFKRINEQYEYSHLSLRAKELQTKQKSTSITFEGMLFFDSMNSPEYYDVKRTVLQAFSNVDSKQTFLNMIHVSTDEFFQHTDDLLFSFGEVSYAKDTDDIRVARQGNFIDTWLSSTNQNTVIVAGGCVGVLSAILLSACYCVFAAKYKSNKNDTKKNSDNDSTIKIQNVGSRSFSSRSKSLSSPAKSDEEEIYYNPSDAEDDKEDEISEFQYSLKSMESGELSVFTYGQVYAPEEKNLIIDPVEKIEVVKATPQIDTNVMLSNMEVSFHDDFESPRSQVTQPSVFKECRSPTPPQPGFYNHTRFPTPPSPKQYHFNATNKLPPTFDNFSTQPTPLKSNKTNFDHGHDNNKTHERSNTLASELGINSIIEEESNENSSNTKSSIASVSTNDSIEHKSRSSISILESVLGETEYII